MNYILTDDEVGMRRLIGTHILAKNPQWSFARCVYLVTRFVNSFNRFGDRVAEIIIGSFTLGYFNFCVGGYDHTLSTWIAANGRPLGDNHYSARCGPGLADCIIYGLKNGIRIMISKLRELLPRPPPRPSQPGPEAIQAHSANSSMSVDDYDTYLACLVQDFMSYGHDDETSQALALSYLSQALGDRPSSRATEAPVSASRAPTGMPPPAPVIERSSEIVLSRLPLELRRLVEQQESSSRAPQMVKEHRALKALEYFSDGFPPEVAYTLGTSHFDTPRPHPVPSPGPVPPPHPQQHRSITTTADIAELRNLISQHERALGEVERNRNNDTIAEESRLARAIAQFFPVWDQSIQYTPEVIQATNGEIGRFYTQYRAWPYTNKSFDGFKILLIEEALSRCPDREEDIVPLNADLQRFANSIYGPHFMDSSILEEWDLENPATYNNAPSEGGKYNKSKNRLSKRNNNKKSKKCLSKRNNNKKSKKCLSKRKLLF